MRYDDGFFDGMRVMSGRSLTIPLIYIDICDGDLAMAAMLNQIVFWSGTKKDGWFWKRDKDWLDEIKLRPRQVQRARKGLLEMGLIESEVRAIGNTPATFYRPLRKAIQVVAEALTPTGENSNSPDGEMGESNSPNGELQFTDNVKQLTDDYSTDESSPSERNGPSGPLPPAELPAMPEPAALEAAPVVVAPFAGEEVEWEQPALALKPSGRGGARPGKDHKASLWPLALALAEVCGMDTRIASNPKRFVRFAKELTDAHPEVTPGMVRERYGPGGWWYTLKPDWRARGGALPNQQSIAETWGRWSNKLTMRNADPATTRQTYSKLEDIDIYLPPPQDKEGTDYWWDKRAAARKAGTFDPRRDLTGGRYGLAS